MPWMNLGTLLSTLQRSGIEPYDVTVYWDGKIDAGFRRPPPQYSEPAEESEDNGEPYYDQEED